MLPWTRNTFLALKALYPVHVPLILLWSDKRSRHAHSLVHCFHYCSGNKLRFQHCTLSVPFQSMFAPEHISRHALVDPEANEMQSPNYWFQFKEIATDEQMPSNPLNLNDTTPVLSYGKHQVDIFVRTLNRMDWVLYNMTILTMSEGMRQVLWKTAMRLHSLTVPIKTLSPNRLEEDGVVRGWGECKRRQPWPKTNEVRTKAKINYESKLQWIWKNNERETHGKQKISHKNEIVKFIKWEPTHTPKHHTKGYQQRKPPQQSRSHQQS